MKPTKPSIYNYLPTSIQNSKHNYKHSSLLVIVFSSSFFLRFFLLFRFYCFSVLSSDMYCSLYGARGFCVGFKGFLLVFYWFWFGLGGTSCQPFLQTNIFLFRFFLLFCHAYFLVCACVCCFCIFQCSFSYFFVDEPKHK